MTDADAENPWKPNLRRLLQRRINYRKSTFKLLSPSFVTCTGVSSYIQAYWTKEEHCQNHPINCNCCRSNQRGIYLRPLRTLRNTKHQNTQITESKTTAFYPQVITSNTYHSWIDLYFTDTVRDREQTKALLSSLEYLTKSTYLMTLILTVLKDRIANKFAIMVENPGAKQDWAMNPSFSSAKQITSSPCFQSHDGMLSKYAWKNDVKVVLDKTLIKNNLLYYGIASVE